MCVLIWKLYRPFECVVYCLHAQNDIKLRIIKLYNIWYPLRNLLPWLNYMPNSTSDCKKISSVPFKVASWLDGTAGWSSFPSSIHSLWINTSSLKHMLSTYYLQTILNYTIHYSINCTYEDCHLRYTKQHL